ncbi:hypothetical protein R3P38DRAFT_3239292 [Favolaschia claudopus]|uniref:Uncharacterized protein n=1 Tax=Favolaschia claudopus TaxID=2862362 RepID=A0AAV9Z8B5_9AGAR
MGRKAKYTQDELSGRRAQSAWEYRQRAKVNEKARLRMQATRAKVRAAGPVIRLGYAVRAAQHRRDYLERRRRGLSNNDKSAITQLSSCIMRRVGQDNTPSDLNTQMRSLCHDTSSRQSDLSDDDHDVNDETEQYHSRGTGVGQRNVFAGIELCTKADKRWWR